MSFSSLWLVAVGWLAAAGLGVGAAWWLHRRTDLSPRNSYLVLLAMIAVAGAIAFFGTPSPGALIWASPTVAAAGASLAGRRWRQTALGAGGELRDFELARRMFWQARSRAAGRVRIASQGELVWRRPWPAGVPALPMTSEGGGLVSRQAGHHLLFCGATGAGKTMSARRWVCARVLADGAAVLALDPKGDPGLERDLREAARLAGRPFVLVDPRDVAGSARWNPLWGTDPGSVASRLVAPIDVAEGAAAYYADVLQIHVGLVTDALHAAGVWPATLPLLLAAIRLHSYKPLCDLVAGQDGSELLARLDEHAAFIASQEGQKALSGGITRLQRVIGQAWRPLLTPDPALGAVTLPDALRAGAVVLVRTWVDDMPEEARGVTSLLLADAAAAALEARAPWAGLLDEFGSVLSAGAAQRALALMQRARSAGGQIAVVVQSVSDFEAQTGNGALLDSLADNFGGAVIHRQASPESRDWLARLLGTRELWMSTDRTSAGRAEGTGSRRRGREFLVRPDDLARLETGQAVIWTPLGPAPERVRVTPARLPDLDRAPVDARSLHSPAGPTRLPERPTAAAMELTRLQTATPAPRPSGDRF